MFSSYLRCSIICLLFVDAAMSASHCIFAHGTAKYSKGHKIVLRANRTLPIIQQQLYKIVQIVGLYVEHSIVLM